MGSLRQSQTDWMKNWPQGVIVVPIVATAAKTKAVVGLIVGTAKPWSASSYVTAQ